MSTMMTKISFVYLLLTLAACPGVQSALMRKRADNPAQRDQEALMEERHLQLASISCMSLEVGGVIQFEDTEVAVEEAPIETLVTSTAATIATADNKATGAKAAKSSRF
jgi:hypothetical protein